MAAMREIESRDFRMPILMGDVLIENVAGTGVNIIATKSII
jgi:CxxC motif-containing protein